MSTFLTLSIPLILTGESSPRATIFTTELTQGQALSPVFINADIITGLVYEHMDVEPMVQVDPALAVQQLSHITT